MSRGPFFYSHRVAVVVALVLFAVSLFIFYDAYERRGKSMPRWLSAVLPL